MNHLCKRSFSLIMAILMVLSLIPANPVHVHAATTTSELELLASFTLDSGTKVWSEGFTMPHSSNGAGEYNKDVDGIVIPKNNGYVIFALSEELRQKLCGTVYVDIELYTGSGGSTSIVFSYNGQSGPVSASYETQGVDGKYTTGRYTLTNARLNGQVYNSIKDKLGAFFIGNSSTAAPMGIRSVKVYNVHTVEEVELKGATCTAAGYEAGTKCSSCNKTLSGMEPIPQMEHTYTENGQCTNGCEKTICENEHNGEHSYASGNYNVDEHAKCEANAILTYWCDRCREGNQVTVNNSALGHQASAEMYMQNPTCTTAGYQTYYKCVRFSECGCYLDADGNKIGDQAALNAWISVGGDGYLAPMGHQFNNYMSNDDATCTSVGTETAECEICHTETDTRTAENGTTREHEYDSKTGLCIYGCGNTRCDVEGHHNWSGQTHTLNADKTAGTLNFICYGCMTEKSLAATVTGTGVIDEATCTEAGRMYYTLEATENEESFSGTVQEEIPAAGHAYTYTEKNSETHTVGCENCDYTAEESHNDDETCVCGYKAAPAVTYVAQIGETPYETLEAAFAAATEGQTIVLLTDATPTLTSQRAITKAAVIDLGGKTLTLTEDDLYFGTTTFENGTIVVDPSVKPSTAVFWMFANQTLTFDAVKLVATGVTGTYLIGLDGNNADLNIINGSEILVANTAALDLDIICVNASTGNDILVKDSKVNVTNLDGRVFFRGNYTISGNSDIDLSGITKAGFRIEAGQTLTIEDTATVDIVGEPRDGGIHLTDATATYTVADTATVNATINKPVTYVAEVNGTKYESMTEALAAAQAGHEIILLADVAEDVTVPAGVIFNGNGKQVGAITAAGEITFKGHTKATSFNVQYTNTTINIGEGACLEITGTGRLVIGHGCTFNITGNITDAKTADKANIQPSLIIPGASFTGAGVTFNVKNAYIKAPSSYCSSSKSASGTFDFNIENSIIETAGKLAFESQSTAATVNFELKDSVLTTGSHLVFGVSRGEIVIDNSNVNVGTSKQIENQSTLTIKNGSVVNGAVATSSNAKNPGTIIVDNATYAVTGEFSGSDLGTGKIIVKNGASFTAGSITKADIVVDATGMAAGDEIKINANLSNHAGTLEVVNNDGLEAKIVDGKIVLTEKPVPHGSINGGLVNMQNANRTFLTIESYITYANESIVVKVFDANGTLLATSSLVDTNRVLLGNKNFSLSTFVGINCSDDWWNVVWEEGKLRADYVPTKATLYVDGEEMNTAPIQMRAAGSETAVNWTEVPGVPASPVAKVATKAELNTALANEKIDTIILTADIDYGNEQLKIEKPIILDLGGKTLTTRWAYGGMTVKNNPTIKNGTIVHASNTSAIKVWNAAVFEDLVIDVQGKGDANKIIGGIVLQSGTTTRVGSIKNVTIKGDALTNGIETYNCGDATENVIGSMENVTIDANGTGMLISAPCGTATNCSISGDVNGIEIFIKGTYSASLDLVNSKVEGGVFAHDEFSSNPDIVNNGSLNLTADDATTGADAEDVTLTIARAENVEGVLEEVMDNAQAKVNDTYYATFVAAMAAAKAGDTVTVFAGTYAVPAMKAGITVVGEVNADGTPAVLLEGTLSGTLENLTLKNLHIKGANAQRWAYAKGDLVFENVTFEATSVYALHFDGITEGTTLLYKDCTIIGWAAMGGSPASCTFDGCTIKDNGTYGVIRTYFPTTIENCTFDVDSANPNDVYQDGIHAVDTTIKVNDCTNINGDIKDILNISDEAKIYVDDVLVLAPVVATIGEEEYFTLQSAINVGGDIVLQADVTEEIQIPDGKTVNLDLNGKTLNGCFKPFKGELTVKNGSIVNTNASYSAIEINAGKLVLTDVNVTSYRHGIRIDGAVTATINGGTYSVNYTEGTRHAVNVSGAANVTIKAGTFVGPRGTTMDSGAAVNVQTGATVTIEGGNFSGGKNHTLAADGTLTVKGGTFDQDPSAYVPEGYISEKQEDGTYKVRELKDLIIVVGPVATMSTTTITVATMDEAVAYAQANPADSVTYQIAGPVELTTGYSHGILDLGKNVTIEGTTPDAKLTIVGGGVPDIKGVTFKNITIADEGAYLPTANEFMYQNFIDCSFQNVTFEDGIRVSGTTTITDSTVNANTTNEYAIWMDEGDFTMTNTTVTAGNDAYGLLKSDAVDTITITGNTFEYLGNANKEALNVKGAKITASNNSFIDCTEGVLPADKTNYAADGTTVITDAELTADNTVVNNVAKIGDTKYETLDKAFAAAKNDDEVVILAAGTYALSTSSKNITITGAVDGVVFEGMGAKGMGGASVTFNNVTFNWTNANYTGLQHCGDMVYNNCTINGQPFLYGTSEIFNNCTFNQESSNAYNVWTYSAKKVEFNECIFNSAGKSVLIYHESASVLNEVAVTKSTFNASTAVDGKAAIEMDSSLTAGIKLTIDSATTANGFDAGNVSGNSLWNNKKGSNTDANNDITVVVGDETVLAPVTFAAKIGNIGYTTIADAIKAAQAGDTVTILAGDYTTDIAVNKAITVVGETDDQGNNLVNITGRVSASTGATVKNLNVHNDKTGGYDCALSVNGENIVIDGVKLTGYNGMRYCYAKGDITIKNSTINASNFAVHFDGSNGGNLTIENSEITGWVSYGGGIDQVTLKDSTFNKGPWEGQRSYADNLVVEGCTFEAGYELDVATTESAVTVIDSKMSDGSSILDLFDKADAVSNNITIDGEKITYVAKIGNTYYATLEEALAEVTDYTSIKLVADATLDYNAREAYGRATTTDIIIDGQGHTLTLNQKDSDWSSIGMANAEGKLTLKNMTIEKTGYGDTSGAWNTHAIIFSCNVEMSNVTVNNGIAVQNGATLNNVTINEANGYYGLWINGNGQTVTVNGGEINATNGGRGIKIADEYIDSPASVTLNVTDTKFNTAKKAAVLVSSTAGANITASNVDITNVAADNVNFAWVDEDWAANYGNVEVTGATKGQEAAESFNIVVKDGEKIVSYFKTLDELFDNVSAYAKVSNVTVELMGDVVATKVVKTNSLKTYNFVTNVAGGVTMDLQYADGWNYFRKVNIGEGVTVKAKYLVFSTESTIAGTVDAYYPYINGGKVTVAETGVLKYQGGDGLQVKGGAVLTVNGTVIAPTINVWVGNAQLIVSGANAKVESNWIDIWDGAPSVVIENGATVDTKGIKVSRGGAITVADATLTAETIEVGHSGNSAGILTESGNSTINGEIKMTATGSVVNSDGGLNVTTNIADHKVVFENGQYKVVAKVYVAQIGETKYESLAEALTAAQAGDTVTILAGEYDQDLTVNKAITVVGETDAEGNNLVTINGNVSVTGNGATIKNLNVEVSVDAQETALYINGGNILIEGCNVSGYNVTRYSYVQEGGVTFKNCVLDGYDYTLHFDTLKGDLTIDGCTLDDWSAIGAGGNVIVKNSTFEVGESAYNTIRTWTNASYDNCTFEKGFDVDLAGSAENLAVTNSKFSDGTPVDITLFRANDTENYEITVDGVKMSYAAKIGNTYYLTLAEAIAAATDGCTIELLADIEISNTLDVSFNSDYDKINVTINGNGHTIKAVGTAWNDNTWLADIAWNVTLNDVTFDGNNTSCKGVQFYTSTSTLNNVTVKNVSADKWGITDYAIHSNTSKLNVTGNLTFEGCTYGHMVVGMGSNLPAEYTTSVVTVADDATLTGVSIAATAKIGNTYYATLAEAIAAAQNGDTITLLADSDEDVTVVQAPDKVITIDGAGKTMTGTITVNGKSAAYATAGLTIRNVNFKQDTAEQVFIKLGGNNGIRYTSNVTVTGCTFTGTDDTAVGVKNYTGGCKNLTITDCTATGVHSLAQVKGVAGLTVANVTVDGKNGISVGTSTNVVIDNAEITATGYGVRADGSGAYDMTVKNSTIDAELPIVVRKNSADGYQLTVEGNTLTGSNANGYAVIFTTGDDGTYEAPDVSVKLSGADAAKVFPAFAAKIGDLYYATFEAALAAAEAGDEIVLLAPVVVEAGETLTLDKAVTITYTSNVPGEDMITNKGNLVIDGATLVYTNTDTTASNVTVSTINCEPGSTLEVKSGVVKNDSANNAATGIYAYAIDLVTNGNLGDVTATISGGEVISTNYMGIRQFVNGEACKNVLNVTGGTIKGATRGINVQLKNNMAYTTITGGTVEGGDYSLCFLTTSENLSVTGGNFSGSVWYSGTAGFISGGTFDEPVNEAYCAEGYVPVANEDGTYGVVEASEIYAGQNKETGKYYETIAEALAAAKSGETVKLIKDATETDLIVRNGRTLDLNGYVLTADYVAAFGTGSVVDSAAKGMLKTESGNIVLQPGNAMMAVYDDVNGGYIFTNFRFNFKQDTNYTGEGVKINAAFAPDMRVIELLKDGAATNDLVLKVRLTWGSDAADGVSSQDFTFKNATIAAVFSSNGGTETSFTRMFTMIVTGIENVENLKANLVVESGTFATVVSAKTLELTN